MELVAILESLLFAAGEPVSMEKLARVARKDEAAVRSALVTLRKEYESRGFAILEKDGEVMLGSNPENSHYVEELVKSEFSEELSRAAAETLAIVAYKGPLTRAEIEYLRGVNSSFTLRNLLMRGLVERVDNPKDARSWLYRVSFGFLKYLGLSRIEEMPQYAEMKQKPVEIIVENQP